jgi:aspartate/methionine/tyrosine aminotransferase
MQFKTFGLERTFAKYEHLPGMNVLGASDAQSLTVHELMKMSRAPLDLRKLNLGYGDTKGLYELRQAVAESYEVETIGAENVLITVGASEAILLALHTLLKRGDRALVCKPAYQGLYEMAAAAGARVIKYDYVEEKGFAPDLDRVRRALRRKPAPKLLVLNTPHNPTGHALTEASLKQLLDLAREVRTRVLVDEVFSGVLVESTEHVRSAVVLDREAIIIGCLSKVYGLAGLRVGWLVGPKQFIKRCIDLRYYTVLVPPSIVQQLGKIAVENRCSIIGRTQNNVTKNYKYAQSWLKSHSDYLSWSAPQAGLVMLLRLKKLKRGVNTATFAGQLAEKCKVFLVPCTSGFDMPEGYLRLGLGGRPTKFREGLGIFSNYLRTGRCSK